MVIPPWSDKSVEINVYLIIKNSVYDKSIQIIDNNKIKCKSCV